MGSPQHSPADDEQFCYLTTTGRHSGRPHKIEIWFARDRDRLFVLAGGRRGSDWVRNIEAEPRVTAQLGKTGADLPARARILEPDDPDDEVARTLVFEKYQPTYAGDLTRWRRALPVVIELETLTGGRAVQRFYDDDGMDFATLIALGSTYRGVADVGEVLATIERIPDGDVEAWISEWTATADTLAAAARASERQGHPVSARTAYLRASLYYDHASAMAPGSSDPDRYHQLWERQRDAWDAAIGHFRPPIQKVAIPYEGTELEGYVFKPDESDEPRPWIILNNGSDGPVVSAWCQGGAAALDRGWCALTFDGPGQGATFHRQGIGFRADWEAVITPVLDWLLNRPDVDPDRIVLHGVSQAGYWVPRAAAFEKRLLAAVADPGVVDVSTSWLGRLPDIMKQLLDQGDKESFDAFMDEGLKDDPRARGELRWRVAPYGTDSYFEAYRGAMAMRLDDDTIGGIDCPVLICSPDDEQFRPGQSQQLFDALTGPKEILPFTRHEGANWHCEVAAQGVRDERVFDWLERIITSA